MMAVTRRDPVRAAVRFVEDRLGKRCFAPLTGQDWHAFRAWVYLIELYLCSDDDGRRAAADALRAVLRAPQPQCLPLFRAAIPAVGDWSHEAEIWREMHPSRDATVGALEKARDALNAWVLASPRNEVDCAYNDALQDGSRAIETLVSEHIGAVVNHVGDHVLSGPGAYIGPGGVMALPGDDEPC